MFYRITIDYEHQMSVYIPADIQDSENLNAFVTDASKFILDILKKTKGKLLYYSHLILC